MLKLKVDNFGPVKKGDIEFNQLTLFLGPNNAGKSYCAILLKAIYDALLESTGSHRFEHTEHFVSRRRYSRFNRYMRKGSRSKYYRKSKSNFIKSLKAFTKNSKRIDSLLLEDSIIKDFINSFIRERFIDYLRDEIRAYFQALIGETYERQVELNDFSDLVTKGESYFRLKISFKGVNIYVRGSSEGIRVTWADFDIPRVEIKIDDKIEFVSASLIEKEVDIKITINRSRLISKPKKTDLSVYDFDFLYIVLDDVLSKYFLKNIFYKEKVSKKTGGMPRERECYYLPAARSGILQGHKTLAGWMVQTFSQMPVLIRGVRAGIPGFPKLAGDFLATLLELPTERKGPLFGLGKEMENRITEGEIITETRDDYIQEIYFDFRGMKLPLSRASSSVSELGPLLIFTKYLLQPGDIIVIEEPEAHLHPSNQLKVATLVAALVRAGVYVLITTHSDYLFERINNYLLLDQIEPSEREKIEDFEKEEYIKPEEISAFVYKKTDSTYNIKELKPDATDGFSDESFMEVAEALYDETYLIRRKVGN
jgi:predicted ATPase